jgi:hypothetical protein
MDDVSPIVTADYLWLHRSFFGEIAQHIEFRSESGNEQDHRGERIVHRRARSKIGENR